MPSPAPRTMPSSAKRLDEIGTQLRATRKRLGISMVTSAESAGMSRVTLHRIEQGNASVTIGAYLAAANALGLTIALLDPTEPSLGDETLTDSVVLAEYPVLQGLAWHLDGVEKISGEEALQIYERHWRHIDTGSLDFKERRLLDALSRRFGAGKLLV